MQTERLLALAVVVKVFGKNREKVFGKSGKTGKWEKSGLFPFSRFPVFPKHSSGQKLFGWRLLENCLEKRENGKSEDFSRFPVFPLFPNTRSGPEPREKSVREKWENGKTGKISAFPIFPFFQAIFQESPPKLLLARRVFGKNGKTGKREKSGFFPFSRFPLFPKHFFRDLGSSVREKWENGKTGKVGIFPVFPFSRFSQTLFPTVWSGVAG